LNDAIVGYGIILAAHQEKSWLTGCLLPEWRGLGFGAQLFTHLIKLAFSEPWLEVLNTNTRGRALYEKLGFCYAATQNKASSRIMHYCGIPLAPTICVIVPTISRPTLRHTMDSVLWQKGGLYPGDECIIVGDGPQPWAEKQVAMHPEWFKYHESNDGKMWGHPQCNAGIELASADYIVFQDDDDLFCQSAFNHIRSAIRVHAGSPLIFRFNNHDGLTHPMNHVIKVCYIGGHCLVTPNVQSRIGRWGMRYEGDFDYIHSTLDLYGGDKAAVFIDELISVCRPHERRLNVALLR
jgi:Acetyltransferase (GNAT) family/Glycosyl transferase family 2